MLTETQKQHGPFAIEPPESLRRVMRFQVWVVSDDRLRLVRESTDPEWLRAVISDRDVQIAVRTAAERRLRKIQKS